MSLSYPSIAKHPKCFQKLTGLSVQEFAEMVDKVRPAYLKWEDKKKASGRPSGFASLEDKLLCMMMYYRTYMTHTFLGTCSMCIMPMFVVCLKYWNLWLPRLSTSRKTGH